MEAYKNRADKLVRPDAPEIEDNLSIEHSGTDPVCYLQTHQSYQHVYGTVASAWEEYLRSCAVHKAEPVRFLDFRTHLHAPYGQFKHWMGPRLEGDTEYFNCYILTKKLIY